MRLIGITGGIGSGKSAAAQRFAEKGIPVVDADKVGHMVIAPGGAAEADVIAAFGEDILTSGKIDRTKLAARVFGSPEQIQQLNGIVHPRLFAEVARQVQEHAAAGARAVLVDAALLGENGKKEDWLDALILVSSPVPVRLERLHTYRHMPREEAQRRMASQSDPEQKRALARWTIDNGGTLEELHAQVDAIAKEILEDGA